MDYVKYALKGKEELGALFAGRDNIFILACSKCYKEYDTFSEPEREELAGIAAELGITVSGTAQCDFLCREGQLEKCLAGGLPEGAECAAVLACGLGIQRAFAGLEIPVIAAADTLSYTGQHGMALTQKTCGACAQCYLNLTGGICPVTDCSKGLLNGQCGGAKDGKCEIDPKKDCAWVKIYQRLGSQGRNPEFLAQPVQLRDYSKAGTDEIRAYADKVRAARTEGFPGGVHPEEHKGLTSGLPLKVFPAPDTVTVPLSMHIGAAARPLVTAGDYVKAGQLIGEQSGFISAPVHASVSGTVLAVEPHDHPSKGPGVLSVVIKNDGLYTMDESVKPGKALEELTPEEIVETVKEKGLVGMGGASFPTYVKLSPGKPIDTVLINGSECEPWLSADHRILLEYADDVIYGLKAIMKAVGAPEGIIVIENNKPDAIALLEEKTAGCNKIRVLAAKTKYPEGAEKMLIFRALGRKVPSGKLPADVGCVVSNASSAKAVADALTKGLPLIERAVTVSGEKVKYPGNYLVRIGTSVRDLLNACGADLNDASVLKLGGPMMGVTPVSADVPVLKATNGILVIPADPAEAQECIRCGRCVDACPMGLEPLNLLKYAAAGNAEKLLELNIMDCFSCRSCDHVCSSRIPLASCIAAGKALAAPLLKK